MTRVTDVFVDAGLLAHDTGQLPEALELLAVRLDMAGAGELLAQLTRSCFDRHGDDGICPACGHDLKAPPGDPHPRPTPPPTPPPPPPTER